MAQFYSAKRRVTTRQIITVTVNDLDPFGQGVARHQGKALFVSGVLPHEQAEVVLVEDKKQYARAEVKRRLTDSPQRQRRAAPILASAADANNNMPAFRFSSKVNAPRWGD